MSGRHELVLLARQGLLNALDLHFAELLCRLAEDTSLELALAAALTCNALGRGHPCLQLESVADCRLGSPPVCRSPEVNVWVHRLRHSAMVGAPGDFRPLILDPQGRLYLQRYWSYEHAIAQDLLQRARSPAAGLKLSLLQQSLTHLFPDTPGQMQTHWQKLAAATALLQRFTLISGGPGTGKTSIVVRILALLQQQAGGKLKIALTAPTGKAAARLQRSIRLAKERLAVDSEVVAAIPDRAATLHRLLGSRPDRSSYRYHAGNPLPLDALVMDEASMVDIALMAKLMQALPGGCRLILLGDRHQLASVEAGSVLGDIYGRAAGFSPGFRLQLEQLTGERLPPTTGTGSPLDDCVVTLQHSYRFEADSAIGRLADAVNRGDGAAVVRQLVDGPSSGDGVTLLDGSRDPLSLALAGYRNHLRLAREGAPSAAVFEAFERYRILTALNAGPRGSDQLNQAIEQQLTAVGLTDGTSSWYPGRPVMIRRNDYNLRLYNGDIGIFLKDEAGQLRVCFPDADGQYRWITPSRLPLLEPAYAMTVHKSQGSEFDQVLLVLPEKDTPLLTRELLYTAVTRAKVRFAVSGSGAILEQAVARRLQRPSGLMDALWGAKSDADIECASLD